MTQGPEPGERPPGRRLERAPGERYAATPTVEQAPQRRVTRAVVVATITGLAGAALMVLLAGELAVSFGLLIIAALMGRFIGLALRTARGALTPARARTIGLALATTVVGLAQVGIWLFARSEGGVLEFTDYLGQTFGLLVPLEFAIAAVIAVLSAD